MNIAFFISASKERETILKAIQDMEEKTCIQFQDVTNEEERPQALIDIKPDDPKGG